MPQRCFARSRGERRLSDVEDAESSHWDELWCSASEWVGRCNEVGVVVDVEQRPATLGQQLTLLRARAAGALRKVNCECFERLRGLE